ncbi:phosphotyrosine protein phosphatase [Candidatus Woesearchaeota archaeon]|nr:phosphotyrosine protein phosphatase [Candidatus Woesearchaeota archaeon]
MNVLFICNQNQNRSKTAEALFSKKYHTQSAGLYNARPVSKSQLLWADVVVVMEDEQRTEIARRYSREYLAKKIVSFSIPDRYKYMQPELITLLKTRLKSLL